MSRRWRALRTSGRRHLLSRVITILALTAACLIQPPDLRGQAARDTLAGGPVSPDSADRIRAALVRPPPFPEADGVDAVALPFRAITYPLVLAGGLLAEVIGILGNTKRPTLTDRYIRPLIDWGLVPEIGSFGPRSGFLGLQLRLDRFDPFFVEGALSARLSQLFRTGLLLQNSTGAVEPAYEFRRNPQLLFWGLGSDSRRENESDFLGRSTAIGADGRTGTGVFGVTAGAHWVQTVTDGGRSSRPDMCVTFDCTTLYGSQTTLHYARFGLTTSLDFTHPRGFQKRGVYLEAGSELYAGTGTTESDFYRVRGRFVGYLPINLRQSLAVQGLLRVTRAWRGEIPFYELAQLGDKTGARALPPGRFADRDMAALMLDWRYEIWRELHEQARVEWILFADVGGVKPKVTDLTSSDLKWSYGFGAQLKKASRLKYIALVAFGDEGVRFIFETKWAY